MMIGIGMPSSQNKMPLPKLASSSSPTAIKQCLNEKVPWGHFAYGKKVLKPWYGFRPVGVDGW